MTYDPPPHLTQHWQLTKPGSDRQARHGRLAVAGRGAGRASPCSTRAATRWMRRSPPRWRWPRSSPGTAGWAASASRWCTAPGRRRAEAVDFGPLAPARARPIALQADRQGGGRPVRLAGGRGRPQRARTALLRHPLGHRRLCAACTRRWGKLPLAEVIAPAMALAKRGLPQDWYTTLKVATSAASCGSIPRARGSICRTACRRSPPYQGTPGYLPARQPAGHAGAAARGRAARLLRGRDRRQHRRRRGGDGRLPRPRTTCAAAEARVTAPQEVPFAGGAAARGRPDRGADHGARARAHGARRPARGPDAAWFRALARAMKAGLCRAPGRPRRRRADGAPRAAPRT